jgi:hypothetical protein
VATQKVKKQQSEQAALIAVGIVFLLMLVLCSGVLTSSSSCPSTSVSSPPSASSWKSLTSGIQYDDATDHSDREKEEIISAAKKLTHTPTN